MAFTTGDNNFGTAKWIVDPTSGQGTHTTIGAALTAASSGQTIFIRPGTYTENLTLKAGVNLVAYEADSLTPNVTISGKCSFSSAGTVSISGIRLQTNSDFALAVTGIAASIVNLKNCYINCTNNTGISFTATNTSAHITLMDCFGDLGTTLISVFSQSSTGILDFLYCDFTNSGNTAAANAISAGTCRPTYSSFGNPFSTSSTGILQAQYSDFYGSGNTALTHNATSASSVCDWCSFNSATASAISVGAGATLELLSAVVISSNTNAITGAGILKYGVIEFEGSSSTINTTTVQNWNASIPSITSADASTSFSIGNNKQGLLSAASVGGTCQVTCKNTDNTNASSAARITASCGGNSAGDAYSLYDCNVAGKNWEIGTQQSSGSLLVNVGANTGTANLSGTNVITCASSGNVNFTTSISLAGGTALSNYTEGTWTPTLVGESTAGTTTYTSQSGFYTRVGNSVTVWGKVTITAATGTGNMLFGSLPFTVKNQDFLPGGTIFTVNVGTNFPWPAGTTMASFAPVSNSTNARMTATGSTTNSANVQITNNAGTWYFQATYQI